MRDAFGGVFMMRLMLVFITIFVAFSAVSLNYAKAFRVKNRIIDVIEQAEIQDIKYVSSHSKKIDDIVENASYDKSRCKNGPITNEEGDTIGECRSGIVITINKERSNNNYIYYDITTYGGWNLSVLNMLLALGGSKPKSPIKGAWAITGEAKVRNYNKSNNHNVINKLNPDIPFSDWINGDRCYNGTWVRVVECQPDSANVPYCKLKNGTNVIRNKLHENEGCQIPDESYTVPKDGSGYRCYDKKKDKKENKWIYITECQDEKIIGAHCKIRNSNEEVIRTYLTTGRGCTTPKPAG